MNHKKTILLCSVVIACLTIPASLWAHCDTMDGPVVKAAMKALEIGNVNYVLIWVQKKDEVEIKKAFERTLEVRKLSPRAKELADMYFFETLVRVHREGEGAPYTGLKPAGSEVEPGIEAADKAIEQGSADQLQKDLNTAIGKAVTQHFAEVRARKRFNLNDTEAGREFVRSYVQFIHYVEGLFQAIERAGNHQGHESKDLEMKQ